MFASPLCISRTCFARTIRLLLLVESLVVSYLKTWMVPAAKLFLWSREVRVAVKFVVACRIPEVMLDTRSWSYVRRGPVKSEGGIEEKKEDWVI